jgi:hypothetical protein
MTEIAQFVQSPAAVKWLLGTLASALASAAGMYIRATYRAATNCLPTIQRNTEKTNDLLTELNGYFRAKAEDGKLGANS